MNPIHKLFQTLPTVESGYIAGVAIFNAYGIPIDSYSIATPDDGRWLQVALQSLSVQSLLKNHLQLQGLEQLIIRSDDYKILLRRGQQGYECVFIHQPPLEQLADQFAHYRTAS